MTQALYIISMAASFLLGSAGARADTPDNGQATSPETQKKDPQSAPKDKATPAPRPGDESAKLRAEISHWQKQAEAFREARNQAPERLSEVGAAIAKLQSEGLEPVDTGADPEQLAYDLALAEQELAELQVQEGELDAEPRRRAERRKALPTIIAKIKAKARQLSEDPSPDPQDEEAVELGELRQMAVRSELEAYESELSSYDARSSLLARRRDYASLRAETQRKHIAKLRNALKTAQRTQVQEDAKRARVMLEQIGTLPPKVQVAVRELAERNLALTDLWAGEDGLVEQIGTMSERLSRARSQVFSVQTELTRLKAKVDAAGLADSVGAMLRKERADAPDVGMYRRFVQMRAEKIDEAQLQQLRLAEEREQLADVESRVREALVEMDDNLNPEQHSRTEALLRELFQNQRKYMDALVSDHDEYFRKLMEFDTEQRELIDQSEKLIAFINERVLWLPSGVPIDSELLTGMMGAIEWLLGGRYWKQLETAIFEVWKDQIGVCLFVLFLIVSLLAARRMLLSKMHDLSKPARQPGNTRYAPTIQTLLISLVLGAGVPVALIIVARALGNSPAATQFARCFAHGLGSAAVLWGSLAIPRYLLREDGVALAHCNWPREASLRLKRHLTWLGALIAPFGFLMFTFEMKADDSMRESLARVAFLLTMIAIGIFGHLVLRQKGALTEILRARGGRYLSQPRQRVLLALATLIPLAFTLAAAVGYYWTALMLSVRWHFTLGLLFALLLGSDLLRRFALIAKRNVAAARAEELRAAKESGSDDNSEPALTTGPIQEPSEALDLDTVSEQTRRLSSFALTLGGLLGLGAIWADLLPAAGILRKIELWHVRKLVDGIPPDASGAQALNEFQLVPVTMADLAVAAIVIVAVWVLLRNLPGLLEVTLFRHLHAGERYAFATILKYAIAVTGATLALGALGITWASIQWLVAAIGLGLGFGLQEIFANLASGLLILVERPIRVGDTVTVGDVSGTVTRIRIRATWITTFDRKELVVPNKEFVTSKLVNWSLSDPTLRLTISVGIAYGSDIHKAEEELSRAATGHPLVLKEPPFRVLFRAFGDSALQFDLQVYVGDPDHRLGVLHDLHVAIDKAFREKDIEIAFPQADVHLKGISPLQANMEAPKEV